MAWSIFFKTLTIDPPEQSSPKRPMFMWVENQIDVVLQSFMGGMRYHIIVDRAMTALDCICLEMVLQE